VRTIADLAGPDVMTIDDVRGGAVSGGRTVTRLRDMAQSAILVHMKTTLNIDDALLAEARRLTRIDEKTALVRAGLEALIARESAQRLAALGGTDPGATAGRRRKTGSRKG
jgi:Arc/MetJ family transcription regulator